LNKTSYLEKRNHILRERTCLFTPKQTVYLPQTYNLISQNTQSVSIKQIILFPRLHHFAQKV
jgi:hypothetical protein